MLKPLQSPATEFSDPVTSRVFSILWETRLLINYGDTPATAIVYVEADDEIGISLILGMDTLLAQGEELVTNKLSRINLLYPIPGETWLIHSNGLTMTLGSPE